jgi:uncharacterized membrane protein YccC
MVMCGRARHDRFDVDDVRSPEDTEDAQARRERGVMRHASQLGTIVFVCLAIWLLTGAGYFWPGWVLAFGVLKIGMHASDVYGRPLRADVDR